MKMETSMTKRGLVTTIVTKPKTQIPECLCGKEVPEIIDWNLEVWIIELC